jgi:hypothetical protein
MPLVAAPAGAARTSGAASVPLAGRTLSAPAATPTPAPASAPLPQRSIARPSPTAGAGAAAGGYRVSERAKRAWRKFMAQFKYSPYDFVRALGAMPAGVCLSESATYLGKGWTARLARLRLVLTRST